MAPPEGIKLIDKPKGITSFDVIRKLKKKYRDITLNAKRPTKIGHAGTLDPLASGLLVVGVGEGTKLLKEYVGASKVYIAEVCIGEKSTTGDAEGKILESKKVTSFNIDDIKKQLHEMVGVLRLEVSIYSAMKKGGEEFYKKARRGENVTPPKRDMEVINTNLLSGPEYRNNCAFINVEFEVGSGTYIRSLAEELGKKLGYPARLENLRRTQVGKFNIEDAEKI